ncbi:hypothetical protein B0H10DRAFT_2298906 [Mycena sp. CBHHK59/15]|nr:hypothetical protein B0H10DRAFT_2298906 [Mycena sp. CBHHK59/15]
MTAKLECLDSTALAGEGTRAHIYSKSTKVRVGWAEDRKKKSGLPSRVAVVGLENIETVHEPKPIQAIGALCMDRVAVLWSIPMAHRPRDLKGPMPSSFVAMIYGVRAGVPDLHIHKFMINYRPAANCVRHYSTNSESIAFKVKGLLGPRCDSYHRALKQLSKSSSAILSTLLATAPELVTPTDLVYRRQHPAVRCPWPRIVCNAGAGPVTFVGLIYLLILSILSAGACLTSALEQRLTLGPSVRTRTSTSLAAHFFVSPFYTLLSRAFQPPFNRVFPLQILRRVYAYGYTFVLRYAASPMHAERQHIAAGLNFGVLIAWVALSCVTIVAAKQGRKLRKNVVESNLGDVVGRREIEWL